MIRPLFLSAVASLCLLIPVSRASAQHIVVSGYISTSPVVVHPVVPVVPVTPIVTSVVPVYPATSVVVGPVVRRPVVVSRGVLVRRPLLRPRAVILP